MSDEKQDILKTDAPFLNRFEKHYIKLSSLLSENQLRIRDQLE